MEKKERDSGLELLRIIGLFLIFWMHGASSYVNNSLSAWLCIVIETIGNVGVPVFILISGYFGIRFKPKKLLQLDLMLIFYCWTGLALRFAWGDAAEYGMEQILSYVLPVIGRNSWYFTCYFALAILSPFLNEFVEKLEKEPFRRMLVLMLVIFSGITTFLFFDITQDGGKGIVNMTLLYLIGRYIRLYQDKKVYSRKKLITAYVAIMAVCIALNGALYVVSGTVQNRFSRDNTLFTIAASVCLFLLFKWTLRGVVTADMFDYLAWRESNWHELILFGVCFLLLAMGTVIDELRVLLLGRAEEKLADLEYRGLTTVCGTLKQCILRFF